MKNNIKVSALEHPHNNAMVERDALLSFINNTNDLMWSVDRDYNLLISNAMFDTTLGLIFNKTSGGKDVLAKQLHFLSLYERAFSGETFIEEEYMETPVERWFEISYHPIREENEITGVSCFGRDVSSFKKEISHLKLMESVVTNATDAILITEAKPLDSSGPRIVYVNNALLKMTGYAQEEILNKTPNFLLGPNSDNRQSELLRRCFENSEPCEIEIVNYKKNGGEFWVHMAMAPVANSNGIASHFIAIGRDVTERLKNIQAIKDQNLKLDEIARIQAHEVRGPLARIQGLLYLLTNYSHSLDHNGLEELLGYLKLSCKELDGVIKQIISHSSVEIPFVE